MSEFKLPSPGADGTYSGSCVVCMRGTDTGIAFKGEAEFAAAGLIAIGVPADQAGVVISNATGSQPGMVPAGEITVAVRVCADCADRGSAGMPVGVVALGIPVIAQGSE